MTLSQLSSLSSPYASSAWQYRGLNVRKMQSSFRIARPGGGSLHSSKNSSAQEDVVPIIVDRRGRTQLPKATLAGSSLWSSSSLSAWPRSSRLERSTNLVCKVAVEPGASDEVAAKTFDVSSDGSILTGDGSELERTLRLVECAMLAATAGLAFFLSNLFRLEV
jgi:hypothetical protein